MNRTQAFVAWIVLVLTLVACSQKRPIRPLVPEPAPLVEPAIVEPVIVEPTVDHEAIEELYEQVAIHRADYLTGTDMIVAGDERGGEERIAPAANGLLAATARCAELEGCDVSHIASTLDELLTRQTIALKTQAARLIELTVSAQADLEREQGTSPFVAAMPELGRTDSLLRGTDLKDIIKLNGPVKAALEDWLTWMRPMLMDAWDNYRWLRGKMAPVYEEAGLPEALLFAMLATESGGKVHAFSKAGAAGPLQFMSRTGRRYGLGVVDGFDMRLDPEAATRANVAYLNDQFEELNDNLALALAAYNGGETRMKNLHKRHGDQSLWDSRIYYALPAETREYVPRILAAAWLFMHPEDYNLEFPVLDSETNRLTLQEEISIGELAICLGQAHNPEGWFRTLRNLNPRLNPGDRVKTGKTIEIPTRLIPVYEERCLGGDTLARARELHEASYPDEPELIPYYVRQGDTLSKIASRHRCVSLHQLAELNRIRSPRYVIHVGQQLKIPKCG